jgi:hypothetical protein
MFDGLRNDASDPSGFEEPVEFFPDDKPAKSRPARRKPAKKFLGLTGPQRFILASMLMAAVCALGAFCLLVTGKFVLP